MVLYRLPSAAACVRNRARHALDFGDTSSTADTFSALMQCSVQDYYVNATAMVLPVW